jgi:hypothetical protein
MNLENEVEYARERPYGEGDARARPLFAFAARPWAALRALVALEHSGLAMHALRDDDELLS